MTELECKQSLEQDNDIAKLEECALSCISNGTLKEKGVWNLSHQHITSNKIDKIQKCFWDEFSQMNILHVFAIDNLSDTKVKSSHEYRFYVAMGKNGTGNWSGCYLPAMTCAIAKAQEYAHRVTVCCVENDVPDDISYWSIAVTLDED